MDYSMIGKIQKAKEYAEEPDRVTFHTLSVEFRGNNDSYVVSLGPDGWHVPGPGHPAGRGLPAREPPPADRRG